MWHLVYRTSYRAHPVVPWQEQESNWYFRKWSVSWAAFLNPTPTRMSLWGVARVLNQIILISGYGWNGDCLGFVTPFLKQQTPKCWMPLVQHHSTDYSHHHPLKDRVQECLLPLNLWPTLACPSNISNNLSRHVWSWRCPQSTFLVICTDS